MTKKYSSKNNTNNFDVFLIIKTVSIIIIILSLMFIFFCFKKNNQTKIASKKNIEKNQTAPINEATNTINKTPNNKPKKKKKSKKTKNTSKIISKFSSHFPTGETQANRIFNIKKIAKTLNNTVLQPNKVFSFQKIYDISNKNGKFKLAQGIVNKKFSNNVYAGGICQVSTALFRAAESAKLKIVERHNHSQPVFYGPNKTDAMFNTKTADFKFRNNKKFSIKIKSNVKHDYIEIKILQC